MSVPRAARPVTRKKTLASAAASARGDRRSDDGRLIDKLFANRHLKLETLLGVGRYQQRSDGSVHGVKHVERGLKQWSWGAIEH